MRVSWKLGRIAGIDVFLHPTFLLLFLLPGVATPSALPVVIGAFGCVLLHELGHALMARRFGIGTSDITLYPIGGVARLERMPRSPGAELLIALAGPAVNVAIVALLLGILGLGLFPAGLGLRAYLVNLLAVNLVLALFNMIPAFPMDGGRVLRALLSGWLGRARATTIAAGLGRLLAVVFGLYCVLNGMPMQAILALFIFFAAGVERRQVLHEEERRRRVAEGSDGIWVSPPGYRWIARGDGVWQLAPIYVDPREGQARRWL